jgi:hypothetical protein
MEALAEEAHQTCLRLTVLCRRVGLVDDQASYDFGVGVAHGDQVGSGCQPGCGSGHAVVVAHRLLASAPPLSARPAGLANRACHGHWTCQPWNLPRSASGSAGRSNPPSRARGWRSDSGRSLSPAQAKCRSGPLRTPTKPARASHSEVPLVTRAYPAPSSGRHAPAGAGLVTSVARSRIASSSRHPTAGYRRRTLLLPGVSRHRSGARVGRQRCSRRSARR